jgi:hypothetical protein
VALSVATAVKVVVGPALSGTPWTTNVLSGAIVPLTPLTAIVSGLLSTT